LKGRVNLDAPNVRVLPVKGDPKSLLKLSAGELDAIRAPLLQPLKTQFSAPNKVGLYLFSDGSYVVENFNDEDVKVVLNGKSLSVGGRSWIHYWKDDR